MKLVLRYIACRESYRVQLLECVEGNRHEKFPRDQSGAAKLDVPVEGIPDPNPV
ncbi:hypothetical protein BRADI_2g52683v3 [Brachypodium distachyon]|uniref:Uncharacterized protein n=1 Tax=Brachypodium distachyon TaxID=15368 RepID=A0A2K2DFK8_BRADI|nr:hypothetical protein BRADI_2g52683v3 [Brachypodium distachyon]